MALLEKAAGQGHAYAMDALGCVYGVRQEHERAVEWYTKGAVAGLPKAKFNLGCCLEEAEGVAAPDYPAAAGWYRHGLADIALLVVQRMLHPGILN
jgi:TPR repeat protein